MSSWMESAWMTQIGWILLHSVWQFALVALSIGILSRCGRRSAAVQHALACCGLMMIPACPILTWWSFSNAAEWPSQGWHQWSTWSGALDALLPWLSLTWIFGAVLFSIRPVAGCWGQLRLAQERSLSIPESLVVHLQRASCRIGIRRTVKLRLVDGHVGPMVAGWFRPIIFLPISIATTMSPQEIELLLAHELAHVRRHDCWINTLQVVIETIFFYHPAVWWLSREVHMTREHCCDNMAAPDASSRLVLARALLTLEQNRMRPLTLALSAGDGDLLRRIRRLSSGGDDHSSSLRVRLAGCALVATVTVMIIFALTPQARLSRIASSVNPQDTPGIRADTVAVAVPAIENYFDAQLWYLTLDECVSIALQNQVELTAVTGTPEIDAASKPIDARLPMHQSPGTRDRPPTGRSGGVEVALAEFDRQFSQSLDGDSAPSNRANPQGVLPTDRDGHQDPQSHHRSESISRIPVVLARKNSDQSLIDFEIQIRNVVRDIEVAYWDLYVAYRDASARIIACDVAKAATQIARKKVDQGTGTREELALAIKRHYEFRSQLQAALSGSTRPGKDRGGLIGRERQLRELMGLAARDGRLVRPIEEPSDDEARFDLNESAQRMLSHSPEIRRGELRIEQLQLEMAAARNQVARDLPVAQMYRWIGSNDAAQSTNYIAYLSGTMLADNHITVAEHPR